MTTEIETVPRDLWADRIAQVVAIHSSAYAEWNGPQSQEQEKQKGEGYLRRWSTFRGPLLLLASVDRSPVGFLTADERGDATFSIAHIGVQQEFKRQGIGRSLVTRVEELARAQGCRGIITTSYNRFRGMLILLLKQEFYIQGTSWIPGATDLQIVFRKDLG